MGESVITRTRISLVRLEPTAASSTNSWGEKERQSSRTCNLSGKSLACAIGGKLKRNARWPSTIRGGLVKKSEGKECREGGVRACV